MRGIFSTSWGSLDDAKPLGSTDTGASERAGSDHADGTGVKITNKSLVTLPIGVFVDGVDDGIEITLDLTIEQVPPPPVKPPPVVTPAPPPPPAPPVPPAAPPAAPETGVGLRNQVLALGMAVAFTDYSTPPDDTTTASIAWDFGDGATSRDVNGQHLYAQAGTYNVAETVTYSDGTTATLTTPVMVGLHPLLVPDGLSVLYHLMVNQFVESVAWNFGDGSNAHGAAGRHSYDQAGTYTVTGSVSYRAPIDRIDAFGPVTVTVAASS